ncbi:hypothetical protein RB195_008437 [Necator americanus]|uniref:C-type lectin domain-containing protein n=1 Tax=Necator americanus TaxID=51031 RepID=A0ABR1CPH9_NECAM
MDDCFRSCYENVNCMYNEYKNDKCSIFASGDVKHSFKGEAYTIGRDKIDESCEREVVLDESRSKKSFVPALNQEGNPDVSWIGLRLRGPCDPSSRLKYWWDGSDVNFQYWNEGEPNNVYCIENSTAMQPEGKWADYPDYYSFNFICQTESIVYCSKHLYCRIFYLKYDSKLQRNGSTPCYLVHRTDWLEPGPPVISIRDYTICCGNADERNVGGSGIAVKNDYNNMVEEFGSTSLRCFFVRMLYCRGHNLWMVSAYAPTETVVLSSLTENRHPTSERRRIENKIPPTEDTVQMRRKMFAFQWEKTRFTYNSAFFAPITYDFDHETRLKMKFRRLVQEDRDNKWTSRAKWTKRCSTFLSTANGVAVVEATLPIQGHHFSTLLDRQTPSALELEHVHRQIYAVDEEPPTQSEVLISAELACSFWKMEKNEKKTAKMLRTDPNVTEDDCFRSCYQEIGCKYIQYENNSCELFTADDTSQLMFAREAYVIGRGAEIDPSCKREVVLDQPRLTSLPTSSELDRQTSSTDVTGVKLQATPAAEVDGWVYYKATNMCYKIFDDYSNFDEAEKNCNGYDGHLASIHSMEHNQFLLALDPNMDEDDADAWIGLKIEGQCELHWMDGSDLDFQNWVQRQPDCNKTSTLMMSSGQWYTENGHHGNPFVCETESTIYCPQHVT